MALTESQRNEVAKWFAAGSSLDEIQKRLKSEFDVHMTYLDLRLLVADLPQPVEEEPPAESSPAAPEAIPETAQDDLPSAPSAEEVPPVPPAEGPKRYDLDAPDADEGKPSPDVLVEMDALTIPGTFASGDVTFSDGTKAKWYLDQQGRLGLGNAPAGFRPSQTDAALFQMRLRELLQTRGMI